MACVVDLGAVRMPVHSSMQGFPGLAFLYCTYHFACATVVLRSQYVLPTDSPDLAKTLISAAISPVLWARHKPDRFDTWSAGEHYDQSCRDVVSSGGWPVV